MQETTVFTTRNSEDGFDFNVSSQAIKFISYNDGVVKREPRVYPLTSIKEVRIAHRRKLTGSPRSHDLWMVAFEIEGHGHTNFSCSLEDAYKAAIAIQDAFLNASMNSRFEEVMKHGFDVPPGGVDMLFIPATESLIMEDWDFDLIEVAKSFINYWHRKGYGQYNDYGLKEKGPEYAIANMVDELFNSNDKFNHHLSGRI